MGKRTWLQKLALEQIIAVAATAISVVFLLAFGGQIVEIYRLRNAQAIAEKRLLELESEQKALEATRTYVQSDAYAELVARSELNKSRPGDARVIIVPQAAPAPTPVPTATPQPPPPPTNLQTWWQLLFGN